MPREPLEQDQESLDKWARLPQNRPSKRALPPMAGGTKVAIGLLLALALLIILALLLQSVPA